MSKHIRPLTVVTGASSGIGFELARLFAKEGHSLVLAADRPLEEAENMVRTSGGEVAGSLRVDLSTQEGVEKVVNHVASLNRPVDNLCANAGHGLSQAFLDEDLEEALGVARTNVLGTVRLVWHIGRKMRESGFGRILITSSTASQTPGPYAAMYFASKAFLESFGQSIRVENKDTGVVVTLLLPGATATDFFMRERALDTKGATGPMDSAADVAQTGYDALMRGDSDVIHGEHNRTYVADSKKKAEAENAEMVADVLRPISSN